MGQSRDESPAPVAPIVETKSKKRSRAETEAPSPTDAVVRVALPVATTPAPRPVPDHASQSGVDDVGSQRRVSLESTYSITGCASASAYDSVSVLSLPDSGYSDGCSSSTSLHSYSAGPCRSFSPPYVFSGPHRSRQTSEGPAGNDGDGAYTVGRKGDERGRDEEDENEEGVEGEGDEEEEEEGEDDGDVELDATTQAEEGSIIVDNDDLSTDDGYGTDEYVSSTTSLAESVRDYVYENGRRYHRFREGRYNFPNDDVEQQREDMKHAMVKMLCGRLHFAPIGDHPHQILDIGTGTGIWAIEMGDQFPTAGILGVDLSPIQPEWVPPNVRFMVDDVESPWLHPRNYFDYIHSRHTVMAIKDWPKLMRRCLEHLRPGGWFEMQEVDHYPISASQAKPISPDHPVARYWSLISEGLINLGVDLHVVANGRLANMMREAGFVNVTERVLQIPIGTWAKNKVLKTVGLYWRTILVDGIQAIALGPLTRGCHWTPDQVERLVVDAKKAYYDNSMLAYMPLHIIYGQKPAGY